MKRCPKYLLLFLLTLSMLLILAGCRGTLTTPSPTLTPPGGSTTSPIITASPTSLPASTVTAIPPPGPSVSNGQRIYNTGTSASGEPINYSGGGGMMMQGNLTCAECHGQDGHGGTVNFMMQSYNAPNITWPVLTGPDPDMKHPPYTEETLKRAITQGLDPGGDPLEYPMPRWQMSASDLNDLVAFIKTLK
jgi:cytochrome c oxidase subunit 2